MLAAERWYEGVEASQQVNSLVQIEIFIVTDNGCFDNGWSQRTTGGHLRDPDVLVKSKTSNMWWTDKMSGCPSWLPANLQAGSGCQRSLQYKKIGGYSRSTVYDLLVFSLGFTKSKRNMTVKVPFLACRIANTCLCSGVKGTALNSSDHCQYPHDLSAFQLQGRTV